MGSSNNFYEKVLNNEKIANLLKMYTVENWGLLSNFERRKLFSDLVKSICSIYPETESVKVKFVSDNNDDGSYYDYTEFLNDDFIGDDNPYNILFVFMHEYRHALQQVAETMYLKNDEVHDAFSLNRVRDICLNDMTSDLDITINYVEAGQFDYYEYFIQPVEYDADKFAYNFMQVLKDNICEKEEDKEAIEKASASFIETKNQITYSREDVIDFGRVYKLNYNDFIASNCTLIQKENEIAKCYLSLVDDIEKLNKDNIFSLFTPCFWRRFSLETKKVLIEKCFEFYDYDFSVRIDSNIYIDDEYVFSGDSFELAEKMFELMAQKELDKILNKEENELNEVEKSIVFNLKEGNEIEEFENPFMYHVQPYMYFMHQFVFNMSKTFYEQQENVFECKGNNFDKYKKLIAKHDIDSINKKVKMLTNDNPLGAYMKMIKQKKNVSKRKALV